MIRFKELFIYTTLLDDDSPAGWFLICGFIDLVLLPFSLIGLLIKKLIYKRK